MARAVDRIAERIAREARRAVLRDIGGAEAEIDAAYRRAAERIRSRLRDVNLRALTRDQIQAMTGDILDAARAEVEEAIGGSIRASTGRASDAASAEVRAVFTGAEAQVAAVVLGRRERLQVAAEQIRGRTSVDGVSLSRRLHVNHRAIEREMADTMARSIRAGESITRRAERVLDLSDIRAEIGQHIDEIAEAARDARYFRDPSIYEEVVRNYRRQINRLGSSARADYSMRAATEQLVKDLRGARLEQVDGIVERFVIEKARYQARMIARTETVAAYRRAFVREQENKPHVVGIRWVLSSDSSRKPDVCDLLANQDLYGLGPGGYPKDAVPGHPHANCRCVLHSVIDRRFMRRELARDTGAEEPPRDWESGEHVTGAEWLARQPEDYQRRLLGDTRLRVFRSEPGRVITRAGHPRPVREVLGVAPQSRTTSTRRARPAVQRDRAEGQVAPFPTI